MIKWYSSDNSTYQKISRCPFTYVDIRISVTFSISDIITLFVITDEMLIANYRRSFESKHCCMWLSGINFLCERSPIADELDRAKHCWYYCYKLRTKQEIFPNDHMRRMVFCEEILENEDDRFIRNIACDDESSVLMNGRHRCHAARGC